LLTLAQFNPFRGSVLPTGPLRVGRPLRGLCTGRGRMSGIGPPVGRDYGFQPTGGPYKIVAARKVYKPRSGRPTRSGPSGRTWFLQPSKVKSKTGQRSDHLLVENIKLRHLWVSTVLCGLFWWLVGVIGEILSDSPGVAYLFFVHKTWTECGELHGERGQQTDTFKLPAI
jgi:hypothetical protein